MRPAPQSTRMHYLVRLRQCLSALGGRVARQPCRAGVGPCEDRWLTASASALAAIALGYAIAVNRGRSDLTAITWLTIALTATVVAVAAPAIRQVEALGERPVLFILGAGLFDQFAQFVATPPGPLLFLIEARDRPTYLVGLAVAVLLVSLCLLAPARLRRVGFPLLLLFHVLLGIWVIRAAPNPPIDVFVFQRDASEALLRGANPYSITFPNIYGEATAFYPPGFAAGGRVLFGFPYPPLSLFLALPGQLLAGDVRYMHLAAMTLTAALIGYCRPGRRPVAAALLFLCTSGTFGLIQWSWTEAFAVMLLAATVFAACRAPALLPFAFGALLAVKQYMLFTIALTPLLLPPPFRLAAWLRLLLPAGLVAALITLPLALLDPPGFFRAVVALHLAQPLRLDTLSYMAWTARDGVPRFPPWLAYAVLAPAAALALWRLPRTPAGFAAATALLYLLFLAFNKQAMVNYFVFVIGALCCAVAATLPETPPAEERPPPARDTGRE